MRKKFLGLLSMLMAFGLVVGASGCDKVTQYLPDSVTGWLEQNGLIQG